jgi:hypothetical protein
VGLALVREHGVVVLAAVGAVLVVRSVGRAAIPALGILVLVGGGLLLAGVLPDRLARPFAESPWLAGSGPPPDYAKELPGGGGAFREAWTRGDVVAAWLTVMGRAVARSGENLVLVALGGAGWWAARRRSALAALAPVLLVLVIWTQRRHTSVIAPAAIVGIAACIGTAPRAWPVLWLLPAWLARDLPRTAADLGKASAAGHDRIALAAWMDAQPGRWFLGGQHNEMNLHLLWPRHNPDLPPPGEPMPASWDGAAWRTLWVAPRGAMPPPFTPVHAEGGLAVFRLEAAPGETRPCGDVEPEDGVLFATAEVLGAVDRPCDGVAWFGDKPEGSGPWEGQPYVPAEGR